MLTFFLFHIFFYSCDRLPMWIVFLNYLFWLLWGLTVILDHIACAMSSEPNGKKDLGGSISFILVNKNWIRHWFETKIGIPSPSPLLCTDFPTHAKSSSLWQFEEWTYKYHSYYQTHLKSFFLLLKMKVSRQNEAIGGSPLSVPLVVISIVLY